MVYGFAWLVGGAPDAQVAPGVNELLVVKAITVGIGAVALAVGAVIARPAVIVGGCWLFVTDFVLLLVLYGVTTDRPRTLPAESGPPSIPSEIALTALVVGVVFPFLTMWLANRTQPMTWDPVSSS
ncbi:hypothetical protein [Nocardia coubleae]|uniref:Uncharacterized protein n=1 Tax=Nocardia coubleae TaxID=356147 RepID=A0A846VZU4_9NOCA|nr:hypothetical protein [Nocardia coubleae]NKX86056.1 hypothetical protein [Nocardia coubleae]